MGADEGVTAPSTDLPACDLRLLGTDLAPLPYVAGDGGFTDLVFVQELHKASTAGAARAVTATGNLGIRGPRACYGPAYDIACASCC